jgi:hypothetical protein
MTAKGKINASTVQPGDRIIVKLERNDAGLHTATSWSRTKTGEDVMVARVTGKQKTGGRRGYVIETTAGDFYAEPIQTMWLAPEDAAGVKRAHVEALAEHAERLPEITKAEVNAAGKKLADALEGGAISVEDFDQLQGFHQAAIADMDRGSYDRARSWVHTIREELDKARAKAWKVTDAGRNEMTLGGQCEPVELDETAQLAGWARSLNSETLAHVLRTAEVDGDQRMQEVARRAIAEKLEQPAQTAAAARNTGDAYMTQGPGVQVAQRDAELVSLDAARVMRQLDGASIAIESGADPVDALAEVIPLPMALQITLERTDGEVMEVASPQTFVLHGLGAGNWRGVEVRAVGMDGDLMEKRPLYLLNAGVKTEMRWAREGVVSRSAGVLRPGQAVLVDGQPYRLDGDDWQPRLVPVR